MLLSNQLCLSSKNNKQKTKKKKHTQMGGGGCGKRGNIPEQFDLNFVTLV